jgi:hypothetical protein
MFSQLIQVTCSKPVFQDPCEYNPLIHPQIIRAVIFPSYFRITVLSAFVRFEVFTAMAMKNAVTM